MKKKIIALLSVLLLTTGFEVSAEAIQIPYILDEYDMISSDNESTLTKVAGDIDNNYGIQAVYICTNNTNDLDNETYVSQIKGLYSSNLIVLMDNQESGTIYLEAFGSAKDALDDAEMDELLDVYNQAETYSDGVMDYLNCADEMFAEAGITPDTAAQTDNTQPNPAVPDERLLPRLLDEADVLSDSEEAEVLAALDEVSERQQFDVVIAFVNDFEQADVKNAAYDYYDYNGFGFGEEKDGVYLYVSMAERDLNIGGTGFGISAFTDYGREMLLENILPELGEDNYYAASMEFITICDDYITQAKTGDPYDVHNYTEEETLEDMLIWAGCVFAFFLLIGLVIAKIITSAEKRKIRNVEHATHANQYMREGSLNLSVERDHFLYRKVESRYNPKEEESGGSTVDKGSSGVSHSSTSSKF